MRFPATSSQFAWIPQANVIVDAGVEASHRSPPALDDDTDQQRPRAARRPGPDHDRPDPDGHLSASELRRTSGVSGSIPTARSMKGRGTPLTAGTWSRPSSRRRARRPSRSSPPIRITRSTAHSRHEGARGSFASRRAGGMPASAGRWRARRQVDGLHVQRRGLERSRRFSWQATAQHTLEVYRETVGRWRVTLHDRATSGSPPHRRDQRAPDPWANRLSPNRLLMKSTTPRTSAPTRRGCRRAVTKATWNPTQ